MFYTEIVHRCVADSAMMETVCDSYVMSETVTNAFCCQGSSETKASAGSFGFSEEQIRSARDDDLLISVEASDSDTARTVLSQLKSIATVRRYSRECGRSGDPEIEIEGHPDINWTVISLPPHLAVRAARQCLDMGLGVILEEALSLGDETELKKYAYERSLPLLGGGVQGAVISGRSIGVCPEFPNGNVAILGQSLNANLMLAFLLEERGIGIRHLISTGRRDSFLQEGGLTSEICIDELKDDPQTDSICLVLKSGDLKVISGLIDKARGTGKRIFLYEVGMLRNMDYEGKDPSARTLAELADKVAQYYGSEIREGDEDRDMQNLTTIHRLKQNKEQKYIRGFFMSETMCGETASQMIPKVGSVYSNSPVRSAYLLSEVRFPKENSVIDCAHVSFAVTSRSSMISTVRRNRRLISEAYNKSVAVILADWYGGVGCTAEQLDDLAESIRRCRRIAEEDGRHIAFGAIVMSGSGSPVSREEAGEKLASAGADVFYSADEASQYACMIISSGKERT